MEEENRRLSSLTPYLNASFGNFCLKFSLITQIPLLLEKTHFPFLVVTDSDPLARLIEAHCMTDAGSEIKKVFVLVQRDQYLLTQNDLWPIQNPEIVESWQRSFSFYGREESGSLIMLSGQIDERGRLQPFLPLFYCKKSKTYFSPPCPTCGSLLQQCNEDQRLIRSGLQPYSTSMKRYLFCPSCDDSGNSDFYTYELGPLDPPAVKDRQALIKELGRSPEQSTQGNLFPCKDCPHQPECFGSGHFVLSRMVPFSFYPFFMLIFDGMSLHALDFLSLLSGANFNEIEASLRTKHELGRVNCLKTVHQNVVKKVPLLFDRGEKSFLEILYLKLSFLGEVLQNIFSKKDGVTHPDLRLSINRCWIKLAEHGTRLPFLWDFKVRFIDIGRGGKEPPIFPRCPDSWILCDLGLLWFYTLLVNQKQDISKIYPVLGEALERSFSDNHFSFGAFLKESQSPIFFPENLFWDPEREGMRQDWHFLWESALDLGWSLLRTGMEKGSSWPEELFKKWEELREEVKAHLFPDGLLKKGDVLPAPIKAERTVDEEMAVENEAIHRILMKVIERWKSIAQPEEEVLGKTRPHQPSSITREAIPKTETIPPSAFRSKLKSEGEEKTFSREPEKEKDLPDTDIISLYGKKEKIEVKPSSTIREAIPETETLPPCAFRSKIRSEEGEKIFSKEAKKKEEFQATEIISPWGKKEEIEVKPKIEKQPEEEEFIAETVIIRPRKSRDKGRDEQDG